MSTRREKENRDEFVNEILRRVEKNIEPRIVREDTTYHVKFQDMAFDCSYTWEQMTDMVNICSDILDELWQINNNGFDARRLETAKVGLTENQFLQPINLYEAYSTERLTELVDQIGRLTEAGGASYILFGRTFMFDVINNVFERLLIIDGFADDTTWFTCLFFLMRGAMHMRCSLVE